MNYAASFTQTTEARYPYNGRSGSCNSNVIATTASGQGVRLSGRAITVTPSNSESALKQVRAGSWAVSETLSSATALRCANDVLLSWRRRYVLRRPSCTLMSRPLFSPTLAAFTRPLAAARPSTMVSAA